MEKVCRQPTTILTPAPVVMVSCAAPGYRNNIITIAWTGNVCSDPVMLSVSIRPGRYSHEIISRSKEFAVNLPGKELFRAADYCGVASGREVDKFEATGLTPLPGQKIKAPLIAEAPVNIECRVRDIINLGVHDLFIAEVLLIHCSETVLKPNGTLDLQALGGIIYSNGHYYQVGEYLNQHGWSKGKARD
jgi:flavin reductase (DIM6/NTAB) family NADH-FMN oxidoreductase RutF